MKNNRPIEVGQVRCVTNSDYLYYGSWYVILNESGKYRHTVKFLTGSLKNEKRRRTNLKIQEDTIVM